MSTFRTIPLALIDFEGERTIEFLEVRRVSLTYIGTIMIGDLSPELELDDHFEFDTMLANVSLRLEYHHERGVAVLSNAGGGEIEISEANFFLRLMRAPGGQQRVAIYLER